MDILNILTADHSYSWLPVDALHYCLAHTQSKLIVLDPERADRLEPIVSKLAADADTSGFLVLEARESKGKWNHMVTWDDALANYKGNAQHVLTNDPEIAPEDNASILFTSGVSLAKLATFSFVSRVSIGTTGLPKGVLTTQRQWLTNTINVSKICAFYFHVLKGREVSVSGRRATLRRGEDFPVPLPGPQKSILISVPLFHVTGSTGLAVWQNCCILVSIGLTPCLDVGNCGWFQDRFDAQMGYPRRFVD